MSHTPERGWFAGTTKNMQMLMGDLEVQFWHLSNQLLYPAWLGMRSFQEAQNETHPTHILTPRISSICSTFPILKFLAMVEYHWIPPCPCYGHFLLNKRHHVCWWNQHRLNIPKHRPCSIRETPHRTRSWHAANPCVSMPGRTFPGKFDVLCTTPGFMMDYQHQKTTWWLVASLYLYLSIYLSIYLYIYLWHVFIYV